MAAADCPAGKVAVGGGSELTGETRGVKVRSRRPVPQATKWVVDAYKDTEQTGEWRVSAFAVCVDG